MVDARGISLTESVLTKGARMILNRGRAGGQADWQVEEHTGGVWVDKVWVDSIISGEDPKGLRFDSVFCPPSKRTLWHRRQGGEVLIVTSGLGRVATANGERSLVQVGDAVYFPAGERHWHGAGPTTFWHYLIRSVGPAEYGDVVDDEEYRRGDGSGGRPELSRTTDEKPPTMIVSRGRLASKPSSEFKIHPTHYPGGARQDWIIRVGDGDLRVVHAYHDPGSITGWHTHDGDQIMQCVFGEGRWGTKRDGVHTVRAGDTAYFQPGELHFHGASPDSYILELSLVAGVTTYYDPVTDQEYAAVRP